jgi:hypothetical protein
VLVVLGVLLLNVGLAGGTVEHANGPNGLLLPGQWRQRHTLARPLAPTAYFIPSRQLASGPITRQLLVAVATTLPAASMISALANATRRPGLTTVPMARSDPLSLVTGRV